MKKKGSKKKVNSRKKQKKFFFFNGKVAPAVLAFVFLALAILLPFIATGNAVNSTITGKASFLDNPVSISGNWWDAVNNWLNVGNSWREVIVYIIVLVIIFAILLDILLLTSIFSSWVSVIIAIGFSIIASLVNIVRQLSVWIITITAELGLLAGFVEIVVSIVVFVGLVFASKPIAMFAAKRKAAAMTIRAIKSTGEAGAGMTGLREFYNKHLKR